MPSKHAAPAVTATRKPELTLDAETAASLTDTETAAVDALISQTGRIPTKAEMQLIHEQDQLLRSQRAMIGDVRVAPDCAV